MERQKFPFSIENILNTCPSTLADSSSYGVVGSGVKEKLQPSVNRVDPGHQTCFCCCYCSHCAYCGEVFQTDYIHEGRLYNAGASFLLRNPCFLLFFSVYLWMVPHSNAFRSVQAGRWSERGTVA
ncbi:hypothetical protein NL108_002233 [Boleophthalmus pectinirostris]|nr:hypothetical protein NL108_002233 [Boleophthalmus pectinirostris]